MHGRTLTVKEFRGSSKSPTLWTSKRTMQSWNSQRYIFGSPIPVGFAFKRSWEGRSFCSESTLCRSCIRRSGKLGQIAKELLYEIVRKIQVFGHM